jgi:hypothetical protein
VIGKQLTRAVSVLQGHHLSDEGLSSTLAIAQWRTTNECADVFNQHSTWACHPHKVQDIVGCRRNHLAAITPPKDYFKQRVCCQTQTTHTGERLARWP